MDILVPDREISVLSSTKISAESNGGTNSNFSMECFKFHCNSIAIAHFSLIVLPHLALKVLVLLL